ncbi:MAG: phenylalanine--tRNA ligase subunit beta [Candidatus Brocadiia bacterium]
MKISYQWLNDYCPIELAPDELAEKLGMRGMEVDAVSPVGDDFCIDIEVTANRPDLLGHIGVAREVAALTGAPLRIPSVAFREEQRRAQDMARVEVHHPDLCPRYTARVLYDVQAGPAPEEMRRRLEVIGLRPVNNVVDITNYVLMECGQPEHAFDFAKLQGDVVIVRPAEAGETITLIDGTPLELKPENLVIADARHPVALGGVMGGIETEISDDTRLVLLESAQFDPVNIRRTTRATGKASDSSYRFERGVDTPTVEWASRRAAALMQEHAGAKVAAGVIDVDFTDEEPRSIALRIPRIEQVLGVAIAAPEAGRLLKSIGFGVKAEDGERLRVAVPSFRPDVRAEIDLVEEVARCHGYDRVPETSTMTVTAAADSKFDRVAVHARETFLRLGYHEAVTTSFLSEQLARLFSPWDGGQPLRVANPLRADQAALRQSLLPSLLEGKRTNQDQGSDSVRLFELGRVYLSRRGGHRLPEERHVLAALADEDFRHLKGAGQALLDQLGLGQQADFEPVSHPFLTPGVAGAWRLGQSTVGYVGEVEDEAVARFGLRTTPCACEFDLDALVAPAKLEGQFHDLPRYPAVARDLAIVVDEGVTWEQVLEAVRGAAGEHLERVDFGEVYRGEQVERGKKSLFFSLTFRAPDRTLTHEEVNTSQERVVAELADRLGASLRE